MKDLIKVLAQALVDHPDDIEITETKNENGVVVISLKVSSEDVGKVIGKQGRTARALRTLAAAGGAKMKKRIMLEIIE